MHLKKDTRLQNGKYTILEVLGQGGFGITYKAETADGQIVAIKEFFMKDACMRDVDTIRVTVPTEGAKADVERYRKKFIKEANNLLSLRHPNIVEVYEVFEENDTNYYAMQYMPGGSLRDLVLKQGPLSEETAQNYILQVASALRYMHERKHLCHYDVKPGNILIDNEGQAMLIDFGLSKNYDKGGQQTSSTPVGISAGYAPIEQYRQTLQEFSPTTDVYALGATLFFLLTAQNPPEASEVLEQGLPRTPYIPDHLWTVITKAMQPVRQQRYQSMAEMIRVLDYDLKNQSQNEQTATMTAPPAASVRLDSPHTPNEPVPPVSPLNPERPGPVEVSATKRTSSGKILLGVTLGVLAVVFLAVMLFGGKKTSASDSYDNDGYNYDTAAIAVDSADVYAAATKLVDSTVGVIEEDNPIDVTEHMDWSGAFIINGKRYPVRLSFYERYDYVLNSEADYTNVNAGTRLTLTAQKDGDCYEFYGSDGSHPLRISVCETSYGHYEGSAEGQFSGQAVFDKQ